MINNRRVIGIIPMLKGSKRLKNKNIRMLDGKQMFAYTTNQAMKSKYIDEIIITTDYDESVFDFHPVIKNEFIIIKRPPELSNENSKTVDAIIDVLERCHLNDTDIIVLLQVTSPLRYYMDIDKSLDLFILFEIGVMSVSDQCYPIRNGAVFVNSVEYIRNNKSLIPNHPVTYCMPKKRSIDVNTIEDFQEAEKILIKRRNALRDFLY